ncbi:DUF1993 domain-containing protein [Pendulispora brunnea]|uniref:DUF1993 domain-containing protein n=1 Tax=Pendulispora brunnea TaxID=2905690 RepID=A0ABZ2KA37_9BACT
MPLNPYDFSVAVFVRGLTNLKACLAKAEAHASANGLEPLALIHARLASDMYDLATQIHWAAEGAKLAIDRLMGTKAPPPPAIERTTFAELHEAIDAAIVYLKAVDPQVLERGLDATIEIPARSGTITFAGAQFLAQFALPNFFFHMTAAYAILRERGVPLTKNEFMGPMG